MTHLLASQEVIFRVSAETQSPVTFIIASKKSCEIVEGFLWRYRSISIAFFLTFIKQIYPTLGDNDDVRILCSITLMYSNKTTYALIMRNA